MSSRFEVPGDESPPSTPERNFRGGSGSYRFGENPSTTPAGPPPSSAASFTPAGAPSASYLGSSIIGGMTSPKPPSFSSINAGSSAKNLFAQRRNSPLGRSIQASKSRQPSRLSKQMVVDEEEEELPDNRPGTFSMSYDDTFDDTYDDGDEDGTDRGGEDDDDALEEAGRADVDDDDLWLNMQNLPDREGGVVDDSDLMMFTTPAATARVRREAADIARVSAAQSITRRHDYRYAVLAKDLHSQLGCAPIAEAPDLILRTEADMARLYNDGVGESDDAQKLDDTLAMVAGRVASVWKNYADGLPQPDEEQTAEIGPGPRASPFEKANYLANLALQIHHTRLGEDDKLSTEPLPETLFRWLSDYHNLYPSQFQEVNKHRPSPACHGLFWQTVFVSLLRGRVGEAQELLKNAGWGHVRRGHRGDYAYTNQALENVEHAVEDTCSMLENCPGIEDNWELWGSDWTLFRIRAKGALEQLRRFAEGRDDVLAGSTSTLADSTRGRQSMTGLARKAESRVPWDIYENLNIVFDIALGSETAILAAAQDWCEATIGLLGWWDESKTSSDGLAYSHSQSLALPSLRGESESYLDRLARAFHAAVESDFHFNSLNPVEVGMACVFEDNIPGLIGILRSWSLPIASVVAEIASLGGWLAPHQPSGLLGMGDLDMDDLEVLGVDGGSPDEVDGVKDATLIRYARELANFDELSSVRDKSGVARTGWELAINVLGRMDSPERSEEMVEELVRDLIDNLSMDSGATVDKVWRSLNELGMIPLAEGISETYGDVLSRESHRYGEAMWYYALAHRPNKVREVMNLLISYSLLQSTSYPPPADLDDHLRRLLAERNATLEELAKQDLEAAELLGKMLSGYASLRQFYELRDGNSSSSNRQSRARRHQAAAALTSVIASSDDNIRGGLYDQTRDAIVSEDFLLALLGEATAFVSSPDRAFNVGDAGPEEQSAITLAQIDVLLKAVEDLETVGARVYAACDEFLGLVLASAPGLLKGSTPADLLQKSTSNVTGSSSLVLASSSALTKFKASLGPGALGKMNVKRGWDWRAKVEVGTKGVDLLRGLRMGLAKDLARLWLEEADEVVH